MGCLQSGREGEGGVPTGRGGFQASSDREGFPTSASNVTMGN